jgi:hypothetical protein
MSKQIALYVDGFNIYHIVQEHWEKKQENLKWLDYRALACLLGNCTVEDAQVHFFTAKPTHLGTDKQIRHQLYTDALRASNVTVYEGRFKKENNRCRAICKQPFQQWKEKQTDVNLAVQLLYAVHQNPHAYYYLLTIDTDLVPLVRMMTLHYPQVHFYWLVPPNRYAPKDIKGILPKNRILYLSWGHFRGCPLANELTWQGRHIRNPYLQKV